MSSPSTPSPSTHGRPAAPDAASHFIREIIDADLASGKHDRIVTRFPPEPNGLLHIEHAKSICLNFGLAEDYGGACNLRFDDTNPVTESTDYVQAIIDDVRWLGFRWAGEVRYASDYFEQMYAFAEELVHKGLAYVDESSQDEIRELRGTPYEPGRPSRYRDRPAAESLALLRRMRAGELPDGACVLRARIDMASPNILMRDPLLYRIKHASHHRTGDAWCIYPMYDFAHCLEDAIEHVTHSLCTLEFEINRELYDWVLTHVSAPSRPRQIEFARLNLDYTVMSKRKLLLLVEEGHVTGWDDPRLPTLSGLRRRGVTPAAIRAFCAMIGVAKTDSTVDVGKLEYCIRDDLNARAPRVLCVLRPLRVVVTNYPDDRVEELEAPYWPDDIGRAGSRALPFCRELLVERDDFAEDPPAGWHRLAPGREVRLRYGYFIRCDEVVRDARGEVVELRCTYDPATRGGSAPDGRRVAGTLHWVSARHALPCEVRLVDRLFTVEKPGADPDVDFREQLDPGSLVVLDGARVEPSVLRDAPDTRYQFERQGYFWRDPVDGRGERLVFNRIVTLRDSWARRAGGDGGAAAGARRRAADIAPAPGGQPPAPRETERDRARAADPELAARMERYVARGVAPSDADVLTASASRAAFFEGALAVHDAPELVAKWIVHELLGAAREVPLDALPCTPAQLGALVRLVDRGEVSAPAAKEVLARLVAEGGDPEALVDALGLRALKDTGALARHLDAVLARHADEVARYRAGETKLLGLFMGELMKATRGTADPKTAKELLLARLR